MYSFYGIREVPGDNANPEIISFFENLGQGWNRSDETGWCAAMVNSCAKDVGLEYTTKLLARDLLNIGQSYTPPEDGVSFADNVIVIFWRVSISSKWGHVGVPLHLDREAGVIWTYGGNQNNQAQVSPYLVNGNNGGLLDFRILNHRTT